MMGRCPGNAALAMPLAMRSRGTVIMADGYGWSDSVAGVK